MRHGLAITAGYTPVGEPVRMPKQVQAGRKFTEMMLGTLKRLAGTLLNGLRSVVALTVDLTD